MEKRAYDRLKRVSLKDLVVAVDFDGTLVSNAYPGVGEPNMNLIQFLAMLRGWHHVKLILWTCREGKLLEDAVSLMKSLELEFDAVNANLPERIAKYGSDPRKIGADIYLDDCSIDIDQYFIKDMCRLVDYKERRREL